MQISYGRIEVIMMELAASESLAPSVPRTSNEKLSM